MARPLGLTVSLFIAEPAFGGSAVLAPAKIGILVASVVSGLAGLAWLRLATGSGR